MTRRLRSVKREVGEGVAPSTEPDVFPALAAMGPPSYPASRATPRDDMTDVRSIFSRSHAPSAETRLHREDDQDRPLWMETRTRGSMGQRSSPSTQNLDGSFAQRSFAPTFTDIGEKLKACNDTLGDLQKLGISHVAALPELVLVGDQSAGKSSLMSGLAKVNLPRSAGVGTRCPLHIRLISSSNDRWSCTVSLQQDYDFRPSGRIKVTDVTRNNPFPPWVKKSHRDTKMFKTIFEPSEIEEVLRWAQIAILNHNHSHEDFIPGEGAVAKETELSVAASETEAQFSPNIVALEIKGPKLPDLSFYDLPGVFMSPSHEDDKYIVKVVENLSREYIRREKAIIMWATPMNADVENCIALNIIRELKATDRTIGIMTKADKLPADSEAQWLAMFQGMKHQVGHGYFATSRPPDEDLERATECEERFFARESDPSWPEEFGGFNDRCGVQLLREYISAQLGEAFSRSLPSIKTKVRQAIIDVERQLLDLPELPRNVEHEVKKSLYQFRESIKAAIDDPRFTSQWNTLNRQFRACILRMKPTCQVKEPETMTIELSDADSEISTPASKRPRPNDSTVRGLHGKRQRQDLPTTPVKREDASASAASSFRVPSAAEASPAPSVSDPGPFTRYFGLGRLALDIKDIRSEIVGKRRPGKPQNSAPEDVEESMCLDAVKKWEGPLDTYINKTGELLSTVTHEALVTSLGSMRRRVIFQRCEKILAEFIKELLVDQEGRLAELFESECYQTFSINHDAFNTYKSKELEHLKRVRGIYRLKALAKIDWNYTVRRLEDMSDKEKSDERNQLNAHLAKAGEDPFETEIGVAAYVRGYYMTAATRFVEAVAMNVSSNLLRVIKQPDSWDQTGFNGYLRARLPISDTHDPHLFDTLMEEDENTAQQRNRLKQTMEELSRAMESIIDLNSSNGASFSPPGRNGMVIDDEEDDGVV
ncbi:P-loop containing nucleoside triphosphate hydrolase protein [Xylariomycetidae sp. FL2044]|nr:P-loop containing nucleoside triphosphate hydrolase protein [Xylariomycetidae sp. FL2044]